MPAPVVDDVATSQALDVLVYAGSLGPAGLLSAAEAFTLMEVARPGLASTPTPRLVQLATALKAQVNGIGVVSDRVKGRHTRRGGS